MKTIFTLVFSLAMLVGVVVAAEAPATQPAPTTPSVSGEQTAATPSDSGQVHREKRIGIRIADYGNDVDLNDPNLTPEERADLARTGMSSPVAIIGVFIPIVAIIMSLGLVMIIIWLEYKRKRQQNEIIRDAIAKGLTPPEFPEKKKDPVRTGIVMICFGLGIGLAIGITSEELRIAALGLILFIPGIGYLIYGLMRRNGQSNGN